MRTNPRWLPLVTDDGDESHFPVAEKKRMMSLVCGQTTTWVFSQRF
jgi:hypothetical protein